MCHANEFVSVRGWVGLGIYHLYDRVLVLLAYYTTLLTFFDLASSLSLSQDMGEQMKKAGMRWAEMHDGEPRPLADRLDKLLQVIWSKYDPDGDGQIVTADINRYHTEGKRFKQAYEKFMLDLKKGLV